MRRTAKHLVNDNLLIMSCQYPSQLPTIANAFFGEVTLARTFGFFATRQAAQINIQKLPGMAVVMAIGATVLLKDLLQGRLHLQKIACSARIQGFLDDGLFG